MIHNKHSKVWDFFTPKKSWNNIHLAPSSPLDGPRWSHKRRQMPQGMLNILPVCFQNWIFSEACFHLLFFGCLVILKKNNLRKFPMVWVSSKAFPNRGLLKKGISWSFQWWGVVIIFNQVLRVDPNLGVLSDPFKGKNDLHLVINPVSLGRSWQIQYIDQQKHLSVVDRF